MAITLHVHVPGMRHDALTMAERLSVGRFLRPSRNTSACRTRRSRGDGEEDEEELKFRKTGGPTRRHVSKWCSLTRTHTVPTWCGHMPKRSKDRRRNRMSSSQRAALGERDPLTHVMTTSNRKGGEAAEGEEAEAVEEAAKEAEEPEAAEAEEGVRAGSNLQCDCRASRVGALPVRCAQDARWCSPVDRGPFSRRRGPSSRRCSPALCLLDDGLGARGTDGDRGGRSPARARGRRERPIVGRWGVTSVVRGIMKINNEQAVSPMARAVSIVRETIVSRLLRVKPNSKRSL